MIRTALQRSFVGLGRMAARQPTTTTTFTRTFLTKPTTTHVKTTSLQAFNQTFKNKFTGFQKRYLTAAAETATATTATIISKPAVAYWLYFNAGMVFAIIVVGGLTRLTESGLSITEWNVISGMKPPRSALEWEEEFEKYKQFPEYKLLNRNMKIEEFKNIFYWEWSHRMIGRFIGVSFILPGIYFASKGQMSRRVAKQTLAITSLLGFQGFMGWYMVKSGLSDALMKEPGSVPRVSQYRLTAHLATAIAIYASTIFVAADIIRQNKIASGKYPQHVASMLNSPALKRFRIASHSLGALMMLTVLSGGLVAGLDAGLIYNEFPFMGEGIIPPTNELWSDDYVKPTDNGKWRNLLENPTTVQFDHRTLAETTATLSTVLWLYSKRLPLPKNARLAINTMMGAVALQVTLGISTLIYMVPLQLAAAHQAGALVLLTSNYWLIHSLRRVPL
ncbi:cytochrome oxidase assembly protein-domain-containing protein [Helicostylum pulchrum]|nr:cytochrome oxidase assembly protein-domain-containing protein [Helicostylum pulchrum]